MEAKREPTKKMREMYDKKREDTLRRIKTSIRDMKEYGEPVTKKRIMERAGVSSGTLSKPYVLDLLREEKVCQFQERAYLGNRRERDVLKELSAVSTENTKLKKKIQAQENLILRLQNQKTELKTDFERIKDENALLRGQKQLLLERLDNAGISLGDIKI